MSCRNFENECLIFNTVKYSACIQWAPANSVVCLRIFKNDRFPDMRHGSSSAAFWKVCSVNDFHGTAKLITDVVLSRTLYDRRHSSKAFNSQISLASEHFFRHQRSLWKDHELVHRPIVSTERAPPDDPEPASVAEDQASERAVEKCSVLDFLKALRKRDTSESAARERRATNFPEPIWECNFL